MSDEGRLVANRYRIVERIGTGAMGAVWHAMDELLHREVAIKQLLFEPGLDEAQAEDARQRTMREGRLAARLHHRNAISVFDVVTDQHGQPCLIMEYLPSTSLAAVLQQESTLDPLDVAQIGAQVASALRDAHEVGVIHRDIKPGNVLLGDNGTVKLTDFGISRATDDVTVTKTGMIAGTPAYLAPEVAVGGDPGPESDVFSLGSTLYAATEGQPPFGLSENTLSLLHAVAGGQINPPRQSGPLASVLAVMLHPEIAHRPTAEESEELLAAVARGETPLGGPSDGTKRATTPVGMAGAAAAGAGAAGAGAAGAVAAGANGELGHGSQSGTLSEELSRAGDTSFQEDLFDPGADYPERDYDLTHMLPADAPAQWDDEHATGFDGEPGGHPAHGDGAGVPPESPVDEDDEEDGRRRGWKLPAAIGAVTLAGLAALAIWLFTPVSDNGEADQPPVPGNTSSSTTTTTSSSSSSTTTTTTTEEAPQNTQTFVPEPPDNNNEDEGNQGPPPTNDGPPQTTNPDNNTPPETQPSDDGDDGDSAQPTGDNDGGDNGDDDDDDDDGDGGDGDNGDGDDSSQPSDDD